MLIGDRGDPEFWQRESERALLAPKDTKHSRKPPTIRDYAASFEGPYLELFAREQHPGWTCWGLEVGQELGEFGMRRVPQEEPIDCFRARP